MAIQHICDRCGEIIKPDSAATIIGVNRISTMHGVLYDNEYELCVSCAVLLARWMNDYQEDSNGTV